MTPKSLPKKIGDCIDMMIAARNARKEKEREAALLQTEENKVKEHIIQTFKKQDIDGARGKMGSVSLREKDVPRVTDWEAYYEYIKKNDAWDLLQKRPGEAAAQARWEEGETIPGCEKFHQINITVNEK